MPDRWLEDSGAVTCGTQTFAVLHCPGHTPGQVVFYHAGGVALVSDVWFRGAVGRSDFPRSDHADLINSIRYQWWRLGDRPER